MPVNLQALLDAPIIELDTIDSTNNYAMRLIDADTAQPGLTIIAGTQTGGRGQRGNAWADEPGTSLLMSIITTPQYNIDAQFVFNAAATVAIADILQKLSENCDVRIKWPNDIIVNDKKAGGILIENVLRGSNWLYSIVGFGLNLSQAQFPAELPNATSLYIACGTIPDKKKLAGALRENILTNTAENRNTLEVMCQYNDYLYRRGNTQAFRKEEEEWIGIVQEVTADGKLHVTLPDGETVAYTHGKVEWVWGR